MSRFFDFLRRIFRIKSPSQQIDDQWRAYTLPIMPAKIPMPQAKPPRPAQLEGMETIASFFDEIHEITRPPVTLYANDKPVVTFRADGIDAFCAALRRIGEAAAEAVAALGAVVRATGDADLIARYGTRKEVHYITHHHKARIRKKYRNRVLRRAHRDERRTRHEKNRTPRA